MCHGMHDCVRSKLGFFSHIDGETWLACKQFYIAADECAITFLRDGDSLHDRSTQGEGAQLYFTETVLIDHNRANQIPEFCLLVARRISLQLFPHRNSDNNAGDPIPPADVEARHR